MTRYFLFLFSSIFFLSSSIYGQSKRYKCQNNKYPELNRQAKLKNKKSTALADCGVVKIYYVLPSDATKTNRAQICYQAVQHIQQNWAAANKTFSYTDIEIVNTPHDQNWWLTNTDNIPDDGYQSFEYLQNLEFYLDSNTDFNIYNANNRGIAFIELENAGSAWGSESGLAAIPDWIINYFEGQLNDGEMMSEVGAVGHELGHTFGMDHRDCRNECSPRSVMCNAYMPDCTGQQTSYPNCALSTEDLADLDNYPHFFPELSGCEVSSNCHSFLYLSTGTSLGNSIEKVNRFIKSTSAITGTADITYQAGEYIEMMEGFEVTTDANFNCYILACTDIALSLNPK